MSTDSNRLVTPPNVPPLEVLGCAVTARASAGTSRMLRAGAAAGIVFVAVVLIEMLVTPWFDLTRHPLSALSLGSLGRLQKANFIVSGLLLVLSSVGLRRSLRPGPASAWGTWLIAVFGAGLIGAGVFDVDPGGGAPAGAPPGLPSTYSWHMYAHNLSSMLAFLALTVAAFVFIRRFVRARRPWWIVASALVGLFTPAMFVWPGSDGASLRLAIATAVMFGWLTAVNVLVLREVRTRW